MRKVAFVTGSSRGIGLAIARELCREGYTTVLSGTSDYSVVEKYINELIDCGGSACYMQGDVSKREDREKFLSEIINKYGRIDVLVNNAGVGPDKRGDLLEVAEESYDRVMDINAKAVFFMSQIFAKAMIVCISSGISDYAPRIINISSISSYTSSINRGEYCISKSAVSMITKLFAHRLSEFGIPVFEISPGIIATEMTKGVREKYDSLIDEGITPIRRWGTPEDIADVVICLCSGRLDFCTGQVINSDGGFHIRRL